MSFDRDVRLSPVPFETDPKRFGRRAQACMESVGIQSHLTRGLYASWGDVLWFAYSLCTTDCLMDAAMSAIDLNSTNGSSLDG
jgi:hypothetical protein